MNPRLSCYTNAYGPEGLRAAIPLIHQAGLQCVELALRPHHLGGLVIPEHAVLTEHSSPDQVAEIQTLLDQNRLRVASCNIGGVDPASDSGCLTLERRIDSAYQWFGAPIVVSGAGQPANPEDEQNLIQNLRRLGDFAQHRHVRIALETHKGPTQNATAMAQLMRNLDHPAVGLNFDTANIGYYNHNLDPIDELMLVLPHVFSIHLKDSRGRFEDWFFPALGDGGYVDFKRLAAILHEARFPGPLTIEIEGIAGEPEPGLQERHNRVVRSIQHLELCGF
jgi:inosose dehydratase